MTPEQITALNETIGKLTEVYKTINLVETERQQIVKTILDISAAINKGADSDKSSGNYLETEGKT
jgi:hypothetical protein